MRVFLFATFSVSVRHTGQVDTMYFSATTTMVPPEVASFGRDLFTMTVSYVLATTCPMSFGGAFLGETSLPEIVESVEVGVGDGETYQCDGLASACSSVSDEGRILWTHLFHELGDGGVPRWGMDPLSCTILFVAGRCSDEHGLIGVEPPCLSNLSLVHQDLPCPWQSLGIRPVMAEAAWYVAGQAGDSNGQIVSRNIQQDVYGQNYIHIELGNLSSK